MLWLLLEGMAVMAHASTTYTFATSGEWTDNFETPTTAASQVQWQATGGLDNSGSINLQSGASSQGWYANASYDGSSLEIGEEVVTSVYFRFDSAGTNTASIKFGFATDPNAGVNAFGIPQGGTWMYSGVISRSSDPLNIEMETYSSGGGFGAPSIGTFTDDQWYLLNVVLTATDPGANQMSFSYSLFESDDSGTVLTLVNSDSFATPAGVANGFYTNPIHTFISFENPTVTNVFTAIDNLTVPGQVPEPSAVVLGMGALGLAAWKRRRLATRV